MSSNQEKRLTDCSNKSRLYHKKQSELLLSSEALATLLRDILRRGLPFRFKAKGFSMLPFIRNGDIITIAPVKKHEIATGDIVAAFKTAEKKMLIHRVVKIMDNSYQIKGDNCLEPDGFFPYENILGKAIRIERGNKKRFLPLGPEKRLICILSRKNHLCKAFQAVTRIASCVKNKS